MCPFLNRYCIIEKTTFDNRSTWFYMFRKYRFKSIISISCFTSEKSPSCSRKYFCKQVSFNNTGQWEIMNNALIIDYDQVIYKTMRLQILLNISVFSSFQLFKKFCISVEIDILHTWSNLLSSGGISCKVCETQINQYSHECTFEWPPAVSSHLQLGIFYSCYDWEIGMRVRDDNQQQDILEKNKKFGYLNL